MALQSKPLAITSFISGPEDDLATADVYSVSNDQLINNLPKIDAAADSKMLEDGMRGGAAMLGDLPVKSNPLLSGASSLKDAASGASSGLLDKAKSLGSSALSAVGGIGGLTKIAASVAGPSLLSRLGGGALSGIPGIPGGGLQSLTSMLGGGLPSSLTSALAGPITSKLGSFVNTGGLMSKINPGQITQSYQMSSLINNITGSNALSIIDRDSSSHLISSIAMSAMGAGIPNAFSSISSLAGGDRSILASAATTALSFAGRSGNIGSVKDIVKAVGPSIAIPLGSSIVSSIASNYRSKGPTTEATNRAQTNQDFKDTKETLDAVDDGWMRDDRQFPNPDDPSQPRVEKVVDMSKVMAGNSDFRNMMCKGAVAAPDTPENSDLKYMAMASSFPVTSPEASLRSKFPTTYSTLAVDSKADETKAPVAAAVSAVTQPKQFGDWRDNTKIDGQYGDWRDDVKIDGSSTNQPSDWRDGVTIT